MIRNFLINTLGLAIVFYILPNTNILTTNITNIKLVDLGISLFIISIILTALSLTIKPILKIISFPINVITLGLFSVIINTVVIMILDKISNSFSIVGFVNYLIFSILLSVISVGLSIFKSND
jgi:putative membrane protein